jgi:hypothetical protein
VMRFAAQKHILRWNDDLPVSSLGDIFRLLLLAQFSTPGLFVW